MRISLTVFFAMLTCSLAPAQQTPQPAPQQQGQQPQQPRERNKFILELEKQIAGKDTLPAEQVFKNIEAMKGRPAGNLLRIMEFGWSASLGVECNHCHVEGKWESDEKAPKTTARKMSKMLGEVTKLIKEAVGEKQFATCYMCHRGSPEPVRNVRAGQRREGGPR